MAAIDLGESGSVHDDVLNRSNVRDLVAFKTVLNIADKWRLKATELRVLLGDMPKATFSRFKSDVARHKSKLSGSLNRDTMERISYLLGIYKALHVLLPSENADGWIRRENNDPLFNGQTALNRMMAGNVYDLAVVRQYLDAERGW